MAANPYPHRPVQAGALAVALLAGCASTHLDAQWSDPQLVPSSLRGARIMVACEAHDLVVKRICQDQLVSEVVARGATPVMAPDTIHVPPGRSPGNEPYLGAARDAGATAVLTHAVTVADVSTGSGVSIGLGAFGIGGGGVSGGVGVSAPIGGGRTRTGYALNCRITEVAGGRLLWTAKASGAPSADASDQLAELGRLVFAAADKAQLF